MSIFDVYRNKKVLITGHTGFKGSWLAMWLMKLGAQVTGLSMNVPTEPSHYISAHISESLTDYRIDIRDATSLEKLVLEIKPDMVFHLAAQALVRPAYEDPLGTMMTNAIGSANLLFALQKLDKNSTKLRENLTHITEQDLELLSDNMGEITEQVEAKMSGEDSEDE
jgi:CDP-glucose 4,6-dehydratase